MLDIMMAAGLLLTVETAAPAEEAGVALPVVLAQYDGAPGGDYVGTGGNFGKGWARSKKRGSYTGTGRSFGGGFESGGKGKRWVGTGKRFGSGYEVQAGGRRIVGTGTSFGKGWELSGGEWVGTGGNFGKRCPARRGSTFVPCM
ncbi:MAG: hypothetical protein ACHQAY_21315 [Hyphomicrobiales bacterium]